MSAAVASRRETELLATVLRRLVSHPAAREQFVAIGTLAFEDHSGAAIASVVADPATSIVAVREGPVAEAAVRVILHIPVLHRLLTGQLAWMERIALGQGAVVGAAEGVLRFVEVFPAIGASYGLALDEPPPVRDCAYFRGMPPTLALRVPAAVRAPFSADHRSQMRLVAVLLLSLPPEQRHERLQQLLPDDGRHRLDGDAAVQLALALAELAHAGLTEASSPPITITP